MDKRGQAMVEVAILLPMFFLLMLMCLQVFALCHNALLLQTSSESITRQIALGDSKTSLATLSLYRRLAGSVTPQSLNRNSELLSPWRPFTGFSTVQTPGYWVSAGFSSTLLRHLFMGNLLSEAPLTFSAEWPSEPPVPEEE